MGIDIAIPLAKDRHFNYYELRLTLRSIQANLSGYRDIYLIGEKPAWIQNIIHIPMSDIPHRAAWSIFRKMLTAAHTETVSQNFISWSDDTYLLRELNVSEIKDWYDGTLHRWAHLDCNSLYRNIIVNTYNIFPEGLFYNVHTPCIYEKERFKTLGKYDWQKKQYLIKSLYFNSGPSNPVQMKDPKRFRDLFYSSAGKIHRDEEKYLQFPISRYEADNKANAKTALGLAKTSG